MERWFLRHGEPLASSPEEAAAFLARELAAAVPEGWCVERVGGVDLAWSIRRTPRAGSPMQDYGVQVTKGLDYVFLTHGNTDAGCLQLKDFLVHALVIDAASLRHFGMAACVEELLAKCEPNAWGLT